MAQAVSILNQYLPARLWLCGHVEINADLEKIMNSPEGKYVDYLGVLNQSMAYAYLIKADVGLITIQDVGDYSQTSPNKLYEYMLFHLPFVASNFLKWQHQLHDIAAGIFVNPDSPENISKALYKIAQNPDEANQMASRGNQYIATANNWTIESAKLLALYKKLL
jgi:glycosyltransferase involved in cell wall biosynthesis